MITKQVKATPGSPTDWKKVVLRALSLVLFALCAGWFLQHMIATIDQDGRTAGFPQGVLHGALMPCALPHLLAGHDVSIYAANNTGRTYKLGYTVGVNGCGVIFFGIFFWRVNRWRKRLTAANGKHAEPMRVGSVEQEVSNAT